MADLKTICIDGDCSEVRDYTAGANITINNRQIAADLSDYYNKNQVDNMIDAISAGSFVVVDELPSTGDEKNIYLVPNGDTPPNIYDEYIYTGGQWEKIGSTTIDLSNYYTKDETDDLLDGKQDELTAGDNVTIEDGVISATDTKYTPFYGVSNEAPGSTDGYVEVGYYEGNSSTRKNLLKITAGDGLGLRSAGDHAVNISIQTTDFLAVRGKVSDTITIAAGARRTVKIPITMPSEEWKIIAITQVHPHLENGNPATGVVLEFFGIADSWTSANICLYNSTSDSVSLVVGAVALLGKNIQILDD